MLCRAILSVPNSPANRIRLNMLQNTGTIEPPVLHADGNTYTVVTTTANVPDGVRARAKWLRELSLYGAKVVDHMSPKHG